MRNDLPLKIADALKAFQDGSLHDKAISLLDTLGYKSDKTLDLEGSPAAFLDQFCKNGQPFNREKALFDDWKSIEFLFQLTDDELSRQTSLFTNNKVNPGLMQSYLFFAVELSGDNYARGKLTGIARQINRLFPSPVMVLIKHFDEKQPVLSIAVINRRQNKLDTNKDVLGKVTIIRNISLVEPHRGHLDILKSFALENLVHPQKKQITDFDTLHATWEQIFNVELLNDRFYRELADWYFWALPQVEFPDDLSPDSSFAKEEDRLKNAEKRRATNLIRLLTRLIFCWFLKEKNLIPEKLFHPADLEKMLKGFDPESKTSSTYYQAILQNLFFATLNQRMGKDSNGQPYRRFVTEEKFQGKNKEHGVTTLYRYPELFEDRGSAVAEFSDIPFLNGGLFECLDREDPENKNRMQRLDGFTTDGERPHVPDRLFFDSGETADLSTVFGDKRRKAEKVSGLIHILNRYKFTIVENTPIDQEIALDPELLGKVFETLLASYNEETKITARKQTGSFYTPRPIVDYMVDESLKAHFSHVLVEKSAMPEADAHAGLDILFAYTEKEHVFTPAEVETLIAAIDEVKVLDPACGSGAFPMGVLHKLVYILGKLDPNNERWKQTQLAKLDSAPMREELERAFAENNDDYGRKLYLIEHCLYGVDIQPIAIQISKLRFFISLVCDQKTNRNKKENHGIRPLPNLETKFVAADSLIGLPEMEQLVLVDPRVYKIEEEIESLYHGHFSIQRRDQKLAVQNKIKALRKEMADVLAASFMSRKKSEHIAAWDPFDPQSAADFFDPHWMFGRSLADGFDVVIGNPPWGATLTMGQKEQLKADYPEIDSSTPNSFAYFVGAALRQSRLSIAFVLPDSILIKDYARTRELITPKLTDIAWYLNTGVPESCRQFVYVEHDVCVLILNQKKNSLSCRIRKQFYDAAENKSVVDSYEELKKYFIFKEHDYCFNLLIRKKERSILENLAGHESLGNISQCHEGIHTGNSREVLFHDHPINEFCKPLFYGARAGDYISNYYSERSHWYVDYRASIIDKEQGHYASLRDERIFAQPKIYITRTDNPIMAFYDLDNYASNNFFSLQFRDYSQNSEQNLKAILPLILSSLANYYIRTFAAPRLGDTYIETKIIHLNRIPVSDALLRQSGLFLSLTNLMILTVKNKLAAHKQFLFDLIDACVMECFFCEHMAERDLLFHDTVAPYLATYDSEASEAQQRDFLMHLHATLNAPSHPIRNQLLRLCADSPDLLAIIKQEGRV